jgi:metal-responsive CopG/Arc/MetJ family transcriptional regulator
VGAKVVQVKNVATALAKKRTSLDLPPDLLQRTDEAVRLGVARSRNTLIAVALEDYLNALDRASSIDARFAEMQHDARYRELHLELAARFAESDAETLAVVEEDGS